MSTRQYLFPVVCLLFLVSFPTHAQPISWQQLNGPFGGTALSFASNSNGDIFAGAGYNEKGVYRSTDGGLIWQRKSTAIELTDRSFEWLVFDDSSYIIAGTNSHIGSRVYKSTDNGNNWVNIYNLGGSSCTVNDSGHIYVGNTGYGQYSVSKDAGYSWEHHSHPSPFINCVAINDSGHIFIGGNYTGYRSTDNGANWTTLGLPDGINSIAVSPNGHIFAGCSRESASNSGVYRSTNNGDSWTPVKEGFRVYASNNIVINSNGDIILGTWGWGIWKSTDNGDTWAQHNSGLGHFYVRSMHITNNGDVYAGLSGGGIYRSTDNGESWSQVGMTIANVKKIAINPANGNLFSVVYGMSRSTDAGLTWQSINNGLVSYDIRSITFKDDSTIFCGLGQNDYGVVFRSTDDGNNWVRADVGIPNIHVNAITADTGGNIYSGTSHNGVYKSTNNGTSWFNIGAVSGAIGLAFNSAGDLFLASWGQGFWKLPAGDTTWVDLTSNIGSSYIYGMFRGSNDYLYAGNSRSTDNGQTWATIGGGDYIYSCAENSAGHLFFGTNNYGQGVYRSVDYGDNWELMSNGLPISDINSLAVDSDDYLYAGTGGESVFKTTTATVTSVGDINLGPTSSILNQNYPNPFNPNTSIPFELPGKSHVTLKVYNMLGQEVLTVLNEERSAGKHEIKINASSLSSGVYYYLLSVKDFTATKKFILLR